MIATDFFKLKAHVFLAVALFIMFSGCRALLYDEDFARMAATTNKMTKVAEIKPFSLGQDDIREGELSFYPDQDDYSRGFLVMVYPWKFEFVYVTSNGVISEKCLIESIENTSQHFFMPVTGHPGYLRVLYRPSTSPTQEIVAKILFYDKGKINKDLYSDIAFSSYFCSQITAFSGSVIYPSALTSFFPSPLDDHYYFCAAFNENYYEVKAPDDLAGFVSLGWTHGSLTTVTMTSPNVVWYPYVYNAANGRSYLSLPGSKGFEVFTWDNNSLGSPQLLSGVSGPVQYALSSKHILSRGSEDLYVYDEKGGNEMKIPMGDLSFMYEKRRKDSAMEMVFSHVGVIPNNYDSRRDEIFIKVYTLPSQDIEKLK
ncbi:MAG: hypothetical protein JXR70_16295 [Spirochaetales bacterium]|nr:hypothetical protein [Spirochaetales bacterium]